MSWLSAPSGNVQTYSRKKAPSAATGNAGYGSSSASSATTSIAFSNVENERSSNPFDMNIPKPTPLKETLPNRTFRHDKFTSNNIDPYSVIKDKEKAKKGEKRVTENPLGITSIAKNSKSRTESPEASTMAFREPSSAMSVRHEGAGTSAKQNKPTQKGRKDYISILEAGHPIDVAFLISAIESVATNGFQGMSLKAPNWKSNEIENLKLWLESLGFQDKYLSSQRVFCLPIRHVEKFLRDFSFFKIKKTELASATTSGFSSLAQTYHSIHCSHILTHISTHVHHDSFGRGA